MVSSIATVSELTRSRILARPAHLFRWATVAILAFALAAGLLALEGYQAQIDRRVNEARLRARGAAADVDRYIQSRWWTLEAIAGSPPVRAADLDAMRAYFNRIDPASIGFDAGIAWMDPAGVMWVRSGDYRGPPIDFSGREHVQEALRMGRPVVSSGIVGTVNQAPIVAFVVPVRDDQGALTGLIGSGIRLDRLAVGADSLRYAGGTGVMVVDRDGQRIAGSQPVHELRPVDPGFDHAALAARTQGAERLATGPGSERDRLVGYAVSPASGWLVLVERPASEVYDPALLTLLAQLAAIAIGVALSAWLLSWAGRRLERALAEQSRAFASELATRQQLQETLAILEQRQAMRDAFVGAMSHELRTPVTTIYGAAKLLARDPRRPELESLLADIEGEAERLQRITEDLLVLSRAEHGLLEEVTLEPVRIQQLAAGVVAGMRRRYPGARIDIDIPVGVPPVLGDAGYLRQVLDNLVGNAVKYGGGSPVRVEAERSGGQVRLHVADQGPGLPDDQRAHIFELFYRSPANARSASGTGIGLFVVNQLVKAMGGSATASRNEPQGLRVTITLAADPAWESERPADLADREAVAVGAGRTGGVGRP